MRQALGNSWLVVRSLWELFRYDLEIRIFGFRYAVEGSAGRHREALTPDAHLVDRACNAMKWALSLYWKRVLCLQRSVATARLLRNCGLDAKVAIGCRLEPFASHAWVEIAGRVVNDSPNYPKLMCVLERI